MDHAKLEQTKDSSEETDGVYDTVYDERHDESYFWPYKPVVLVYSLHAAVFKMSSSLFITLLHVSISYFYLYGTCYGLHSEVKFYIYVKN